MNRSLNSGMTPDERISLHLRLLDEVAANRFDAVECPNCLQLAVSVWFTHPLPDVYRTWFVCGNCDFHTRTQHSDKPKFFSVSRIKADLEELDPSILESSVSELLPPKRK
jgi:hypothetical protein